MKLRDLLKQWTDKNTGWVFVISWLASCLIVYIVVKCSVLVIVNVTKAGGDFALELLFLISFITTIGALRIWHIVREPRLTLWRWLVLAFIGSVLFTICISAIYWVTWLNCCRLRWKSIQR